MPSRGPKGWIRSDAAILDELCERIVRAGIDASALAVSVEHGEVTLEGDLETREERRWVVDLAERVLGAGPGLMPSCISGASRKPSATLPLRTGTGRSPASRIRWRPARIGVGFGRGFWAAVRIITVVFRCDFRTMISSRKTDWAIRGR